MTTTIQEDYHHISKLNKEEPLICDNTSKEISNYENQSQRIIEDLKKLNDENNFKNQKAKENMEEEDTFTNSHNSLDNRIHSCHICKRKYETALGLHRHIVRSHSKQVLLYNCNKCNQNFRTRMACNQHKCTNKEKELVARISKENLENEFITNSRKSRNKNLTKKEIVLEIEEIKKVELENDKDEELYSCIKCSSVFSSEMKIKDHIENKECFSYELKQKVNTIKQKYKKTLEIFKKAKLNKKKLKDKLVALGESLESSDSESDLNEMETLLINFMDKEYKNMNKEIIKNEKEKTDELCTKRMETNFLNDEIEMNDTISKTVFLESENKQIKNGPFNEDIKTSSVHTVKNGQYLLSEIPNKINENGIQEESIIFMNEDSQTSPVYLDEQDFELQSDEDNLYDQNNENKVYQLKEEFLTESSSNETFDLEREIANEKSEYLLHIDIINDLTETKPINFNNDTYSIDYNKEICTEEWVKTENIDHFTEITNDKSEMNDSKTKSQTNDLIPKEKYNEKFMSFLYKSLMKEEIQREKIKKKVKQQKENKNQEILNNITDLKTQNQADMQHNNKNLEIEFKSSIGNEAVKIITNKILKHQCPYCDKIFANKSVLDSHTRSHTDERQFNCSYCERKCFDRVSLDIHERRHTNDRRYNCEYCDEKFFTLFEKKRHEKTWHQNGSEEKSEQKSRIRHNMSYDEKRKYGPKALLGEDGLYHCKMCDKVCLTAKTMRKHTALHLNGKPCPLCSKVFAYESALQRHLLVPHEEKNFMCTVCGNRYTSAATLNSHSKVHSEGAIKCPICPKIFGTLYNLDRHMNHKHKLKNWQKLYPDIIVEKTEENNV